MNPLIPIIYEDDALIIVNKPPGILSQKKDKNENSIIEILGKQLSLKNIFSIHRLDRNTSGIMIFAKSKKIAEQLSAMLKSGDIEKKYLAIVKGKTKEFDTIDLPLLKNTKTNIVTVDSKGKKSITKYTKLISVRNFTLLDIELCTGRSHQIRAHLSYIGNPIIGDKKYAKGIWSNLNARPLLHSYFISFRHPNTNNLFLVQDSCPEEFSSFLNV